MDLSRKRERDRLVVRREPYWHRLDKGVALGFRRGADTWVVRKTNGDGTKITHALKETLRSGANASGRDGSTGLSTARSARS